MQIFHVRKGIKYYAGGFTGGTYCSYSLSVWCWTAHGRWSFPLRERRATPVLRTHVSRTTHVTCLLYEVTASAPQQSATKRIN